MLFAEEPSEVEVINDAGPEIAEAYRLVKKPTPEGLERLKKLPWVGDEKTFRGLLDTERMRRTRPRDAGRRSAGGTRPGGKGLVDGFAEDFKRLRADDPLAVHEEGRRPLDTESARLVGVGVERGVLRRLCGTHGHLAGGELRRRDEPRVGSEGHEETVSSASAELQRSSGQSHFL